MTYIKRALFPVLTCHAAGRGDIVAMEELRKQVTLQSPHTQNIGRHMGQYCYSIYIGFNKSIRTIAQYIYA